MFENLCLHVPRLHALAVQLVQDAVDVHFNACNVGVEELFHIMHAGRTWLNKKQ